MIAKTEKHILPILMLLMLMLLSSCIPGIQNPNTRKTVEQKTDTDDTSSIVDPDFTGLNDIYWYSANSVINGTIKINADIKTVIYLRGKEIHNYLKTSGNFINSTTKKAQEYCTIVSYTDPKAKPQLRLRAIPLKIQDTSKGTTEYYLRVDLTSAALNESICTDSSAIDTIDGYMNHEATYSPLTLCSGTSSCITTVTSSKLNLYKVADAKISDDTALTSLDIDFSGITLQVDLTSGSYNQATSCTENQCTTLGYDCCLEGQCVFDASIRPNASTLSTYSEAMSSYETNPQTFQNYPEIFYVCGNNPPTVPPTPTAIPNVDDIVLKEFEQKKLDLACLSEAIATPQVFTSCTRFDSVGPWTEDDYIAVRNDVWERCGCQDKPFPTDPEELACPNFGLEEVYGDDGVTVTDVICKTPIPSSEPTPIVDHTLSISGRVAPHRFFATDGTSIDYVVATTDLSTVQEGEEFFYQNPATSFGPEVGSFNMNSILGQLGLTLTLGKALPAVTIPVEYDTVYIINGNGGYYTPCPTCAPDNWSDGLYSAHPKNLTKGNGLTTSGYATRRDSGDYTNNATLGNYEDTHFGRACYIPPTMIPFSHKSNSNVQTQRMNRLATQAALFSNGYQKDWYGFNKGALIGSFDGVHWFPIGNNGRRIKSTSTKLFLAINAPLADLAGSASITVSIASSMVDIDTVSDVDYDPEKTIYDPQQNWAATCQKWHQCETDSDCISQLGWEYSCADVSKIQFYTPSFDSSANEKANTSIVAKFVNDKFLSVATGGDSKKRCVYRGAGAPCKKNYESSVSVSTNQKLLKCAPNFYCADITTNSFNDAINRDPIPLSNIMYGYSNPTIGRPESYIDAMNYLTTDIKENIKANLGLNTTTTTDFGICRPGRSLASTTPLTSHQSKDSAGRTDYISQIGACDSTKTGVNSVSVCPTIIEDESDTNFGNISTAYNSTLAKTQNSCGAQAKNDDNENVFATIEASNLRSLASLTTPSVALNACLRRAGSVCHSDLDCGPNILHAGVAALNGIDSFGGTYAEKYYWQESLVCGQAQKKPAWTDWNWGTYDVTENRCCREVGQKLTIYTNGNSALMNDLIEDEVLPDPLISTINNPAADRRYSRFSVLPTLTTSTSTSAHYENPYVTGTGTALPNAFQWKTIHDTAKRTCCGGGFVRTFYDGTHDWTITNRVSLDYENFACLNYKNELHNLDMPAENNINQNNYAMYLNQQCVYPSIEGCNQIPFADIANYEISNPSQVKFKLHDSSVTTLDNLDDDYNYASLVIHPGVSYSAASGAAPSLDEMISYLTPDAPYLPTLVMPNTASNPYLFPNGITKPMLSSSFYLPSYISSNNIESVLHYPYDSNGNSVATTQTLAKLTSCASTGIFDAAILPSSQYCIQNYNGYQIFHYRVAGGTAGYDHGAIRIRFKPINSPLYYYTGTTTDNARIGAKSGNAMYYLTKLGRLELSGIPQMFYEPLRCNDNMENIVDGIFNLNDNKYSSYTSAAVNLDDSTNLAAIYDTEDMKIKGSSIDYSNSGKYITFNDKLLADPVFKSNEFTCCIQLGERTSDAASCCSNYYGKNDDGENVCLLPAGADLNVYFNRFVSGDGVGEEQPGGGLTDDDFVPRTGEPKLQDSTYSKLVALGNAYCINKTVRKGAAFGKYPTAAGLYQYTPSDADSDDNDYFSIVDQSTDNEAAGASLEDPRGVAYFRAGYRWNHHYYCAP